MTDISIPIYNSTANKMLEMQNQCISWRTCNDFCYHLHLNTAIANETYIFLCLLFMSALCISRLFIYYRTKRTVESILIFSAMLMLIVYVVMLLLNIGVAAITMFR